MVGLDPMLSYIPQHVQDKAFCRIWRNHLKELQKRSGSLNKEIVDKTYDLIPAVKPQIAMYEQFGVPGVMAFKKTVDYCKEKESCSDRRYQERGYRFHFRCVCDRTSWESESGQQGICFRLTRISLPVNPVSRIRWGESVHQCLQRREERNLRTGQDIQSVQRRVPGQTDRRTSAL